MPFGGDGVAKFAHGVSSEFDTVGGVEDTVEEGVGDGGVADQVVPSADGKLTGDQSSGCAMAVVNDFEQVTIVVLIRFFQPEVINTALTN